MLEILFLKISRMAESKTVAVVPLNSSNCSIQCKMALIKDGLWALSMEQKRPLLIEGDEQQAAFAA